MELQEFIRDALVGLVNGIEDATKIVAGRASINPTGTYFTVQEGVAVVRYSKDSSPNPHMTLLNFDVAVTAEEKSTDDLSGGAKGSIGVVSFKFGASGGQSFGSSSVSRLQFSIPVLLPQSTPSK